MTKTTLDNTSYAWKQISENWQTYFFPPSRPSDQEVATYMEWLKRISGSESGLKALVLGATPELRDVLNQLHFKTHAIDINMEMILALNGLVEHQNPDEVLIRANWLENPLQESYFDVVLGDAVFANVPWEKRSDFYKEIVRLLKPNGHYLSRTFYAPEKRRYENIDDILAVFAKKKASNQTAIELVFELQLFTHDPFDRLGSMAKVRKVMEEIHGSKGFTFESQDLNQTLEIVWSYWVGDALSKKVWIYPFQKEEEKEYVQYFDIENKFSATDHPYGELTPMYLLKVKK